MSVITALEQEHGIGLDLALIQLPSAMEGISLCFDHASVIILKRDSAMKNDMPCT